MQPIRIEELQSMASIPNKLKISPFRELLFEQEMEAMEHMVLMEREDQVHFNQHFNTYKHLHVAGAVGRPGDDGASCPLQAGRVHHTLSVVTELL